MEEGATSATSASLRSGVEEKEDETPAVDRSSINDERQHDPDQERSADNDKLPMSGLRVIDVGTFLAGPARRVGPRRVRRREFSRSSIPSPAIPCAASARRPSATTPPWPGSAKARNQKIRHPRPAQQQEGVQPVPAPGRQVRRPDRELPPRHDGGMGARLGRACKQGQPRAWSCLPVSRATARPGRTAAARGSPTSPTPTPACRTSPAFPGETPVVPGTVPHRRLSVQPLRRHRHPAGACATARRPGEGQVIDIAIYEAVFRQTGRDRRGLRPVRQGPRARRRRQLRRRAARALPHCIDDKWLAIACTTDKMFERLGRGDGANPNSPSAARYGQQRKRLAARGEVNQHRHRMGRLAAALRGHAALPRRRGAGRQAQQHRRHLRGRTLPGARQPGPSSGKSRASARWSIPGVVPRTLSATPGRITNLGPPLRRRAPMRCMRELLGICPPEEIKRLRQRKII
jgi:hypothetical protein